MQSPLQFHAFAGLLAAIALFSCSPALSQTNPQETVQLPANQERQLSPECRQVIALNANLRSRDRELYGQLESMRKLRSLCEQARQSSAMTTEAQQACRQSDAFGQQAKAIFEELRRIEPQVRNCTAQPESTMSTSNQAAPSAPSTSNKTLETCVKLRTDIARLQSSIELAERDIRTDRSGGADGTLAFATRILNRARPERAQLLEQFKQCPPSAELDRFVAQSERDRAAQADREALDNRAKFLTALRIPEPSAVAAAPALAQPEDLASAECKRSRAALLSVQQDERTLQNKRADLSQGESYCRRLQAGTARRASRESQLDEARYVCREVEELRTRFANVAEALVRLGEEAEACRVADSVIVEIQRPIRERVARDLSEREAREQQAQQLAKAAAEREAQRAQAAFRELLAKSSPQSLYLLAGRYEREGNVPKATEVYEYLIDKHAATNWAAQANDRLLKIVSDARAERQAGERERRSQDRARCQREFAQCLADCLNAPNPGLRLTCNSGCTECR
jgi:hypothetical protein